MIVCTGTALIDCIVKGDGPVADSIGLFPGGEALNEAVTLARLGSQVVLSCPVGKDSAGGLLNSLVSRENITLLNQNYNGATPISLLNVAADGNRNSRVCHVHELAGYVPLLPEGPCDFVTMGSLFRPPFFAPDVCCSFAKQAKSRGAVLIADTKLPKGTDPHLSDYADTLSLLDFITPNRQEAAYYTGESDPVNAARIFKEFGTRNVIIKLDADGSYILPESGEGFFVPAYKVDVVDGVGAGDAFIAGLIHSLHKGLSLRESTDFASACAAVSVTAAGALSAVKSEAQILKFMSNI